MSKKDSTPKPMDEGAPERAEGIMATNHQRVCWAIKQLVSEFHALFPETPVEYSNYDGRNTALDVTFDLTTLDEDSARIDAVSLLDILPSDSRVATVVIETDASAALVSIKPGPRTQDVRDSFGLADAYSILADGDVGYDDDGDDEQGGLTMLVGSAPWDDIEDGSL